MFYWNVITIILNIPFYVNRMLSLASSANNHLIAHRWHRALAHHHSTLRVNRFTCGKILLHLPSPQASYQWKPLRGFKCTSPSTPQVITIHAATTWSHDARLMKHSRTCKRSFHRHKLWYSFLYYRFYKKMICLILSLMLSLLFFLLVLMIVLLYGKTLSS